MYVLSVCLFSVTYNLPRFWEVSWQHTDRQGKNITEVVPTDLRQNDIYIEVGFSNILTKIHYCKLK